MSLTHITSHSIRRLLTLTEKKEQLIKGIEEVESEIAKALKGAATSVVEAAEAVTTFKPAKKSKGKKARKPKASKATKSGGLKGRVLALLESAGDQGLRVKEIAEKLAANPANISVWFSTTGKKHTTKVEPGRYAVKGSKKSAASTHAVTGYLKPPASMKPSKSKKRKRGLTSEGRARLAANMKARWAARKAGKPAAKVGKKGLKLPKAGKNPF